ncbi:MAG: TatD family hydrolase [Candidatus Freyarchaeota archaeon]|nr:TatD family hydrolase [Candidatus Freyrarchaeum guaymaensis]
MLVPATDNHMHVNPVRGLGPKEVAKFFRASGGSCVFLVSLPSWSYGVSVSRSSDYKECYGYVVDCVNHFLSVGVAAYGVVGVHPAELTFMISRGMSLRRAVEVMRGGLEVAARWVEEQRAVAIGEVGLPHYPVSGEVLEASNELLIYAMELAKDVGCAIQLHTGSVRKSDLLEVVGKAEKVGLSPEKVVKHFAPPDLDLFSSGVFPSILATEKNVSKVLPKGTRFLLETDYIDDPKRPGAVLGPRSVPRLVRRMLMRGVSEEVFWKVCKENPEKIYGVEIQIKTGISV